MDYFGRAPAKDGSRPRGWLHPRLFAFVAGLVLSTLIATGATADTSDACEPTLVQDWPICSPETMNAVSSPVGPLPHVKAEAFAHAMRAPLPGRARIKLSGVINDGGASCVSHVAAVTGDADTLRGPLKQRNQKRLEYLRKSAAGEKIPRRVVFHLYTPNIEIQQSGMVQSVFSFRHGGLGGWRPNSGSNVKIYLPETSPGELAAGKSYPAFARATGGKPGTLGWLYSAWNGRGQSLYYGDMDPARCAAVRKDLDRFTDLAAAGNDDRLLRGRRKLDCEIRKGLFAGDKRVVTGKLEGQVVIDAITTNDIAGHFDLGGEAQLTAKHFKFRYDKYSGALAGDRMTRESETSGGLHITGQFNAPNHSSGYVPFGSAVVVSGDHARSEEDLLHIRSHLPRLEQRNVDWDEPGIRVTFDRRVDLGSLDDDSFYLEYRDAGGQLQKVPVSYARPSPEIVRLVPRAELKDGVRYRVQIKAGRDGVTGERGEPLDAGYSWNFHTTVDLNDDEPMTELSDLVEPREGIEAHVFQVSRDAALVDDKPTMARVYVKWAERDDVAGDWQVRKFPARVRIHGDSPDGPVIAQSDVLFIKRPDEYSREDERLAHNTVNVYGLDIDSRPDTIFAEVRPKTEECNTPQRQFHGDPLALDYNPLKATLNVTYYFIPVGEWRDGVPEADRALAARIVAGAARFATQNMPILGVNMMPGGDLALSEERRQEAGDAAKDDAGEERDKLMQMLEDRMGMPDARRSDIIVGFMPYKLFKLGGTTFGNGLFDMAIDPAKFPVPAVAMSIKPEVARLSAIAHEFGHVFGLDHIPYVEYDSDRSIFCGVSLPTVAGVGAVAPALANASTGQIATIQGFRMAAGGRRGANKSVIEGNAEDTRGLVPLMFPCMGSKKAPFDITRSAVFITERNYGKLLTNMARYQAQDLFTQRPARVPLMLAANTAGQTAGPQSGRALAEVAAALRPPARGLLIAGRVGTDGSADIDWARHYTGYPRTPENQGKWRLEALDADGATVAQQRFALAANEEEDAVFRVALDGAQDAHTIRLYHGDKSIATLTRSPHAPQARITGVTQVEADRIRIAWTSRDTDGYELTHQLLYAPSPRGPWIALTGRNPGNSITVNRALLAPGSQPTLKLIVSDGFNQATTTRPIEATAGLRVLAHGPVAGADSMSTSGSDVYAIFNTDLAADAITADTFMLEGPAGQRVAASLQYHAADHTAILSPDEALVPGRTYTVTLAAPITDRYGNTLGEPLSWQFIRRPPPNTPPEGSLATDATDASNAPDKSASATETGSDAPPAGNDDTDKGWLELAGVRQDFRIKECKQKTGKYSGHKVYVIGEGADGLSVMAAIETPPEQLSTHNVIIRSGPTMYSISRQETNQGWTEEDGEPADGPLINIRDTRLTVDADLKISGTDDHQHARIEATCPGLAANTDQ